jgi:FtsP/CotA-like multicopper oxidase with cupredoxin domain
MKRRDFLKLSAAGVATLVVGRIPGFGVKDAFAATHTLHINITDAMKEMVTHNSINDARCYFWIYQMTADGVPVPAGCPGPTLLAVKGDSVTITITNNLDEPHSFFIPGMFDSGPIAPGATTLPVLFTATQSGAFLYYDNLNEPVNRVMGLHGALVVRPSVPVGANKITPYDAPTPHVQALYNSFGDPNVYPGLAWGEGAGTPPAPGENASLTGNSFAPPFRQYVWLTHQASPNLFAAVGNTAPGTGLRIPANFVQAFLRDTFSPTKNNNIPQYFTINGQSGFFSHFSPQITPMGRVGEPCVIHLMNAGLWTHSMHIHANHIYITSVNDVVEPNPIWVDVYTLRPMDRIDYTVPYMRPPDLPNVRGIGRPDTPLVGITSGLPVYPPYEELDVYMPALGTKAANGVELGQRQSPLCFPMHDHSEPSQVSQGGNYNCGLISGIYFTGDRNTLFQHPVQGPTMNFPMDEDFNMMYRNIRGISDGDFADEASGPRPV